MQNIEINAQFQRALDVMEKTGRSIFITGRAGTGKSTLLEYFRGITNKKVVVLAPTGVAALNIKGQTIHSFFGFRPDITPLKVKRIEKDGSLFKKLDILVIDEISMVRADLLDCVDHFLRLNGPASHKPFGGIQMVFVGDLYQLPPVVTSREKAVFSELYQTPYFFSSHAFRNFDMEFLELEKVYRQHDQRFIELLNAIRNNSIDDHGLGLLNTRYLPEHDPSGSGFSLRLTTTNAMAADLNARELAKLKGKLHTFKAARDGKFSDDSLPTSEELMVKAGAQVMMLNNDSFGRWVNGSMGRIVGFKKGEDGGPCINVQLADGENVKVEPYTWEIFNYKFEGREIKSEVVGTFTQYPLMLAWAVTIHKSQGKTFERVVVDIGRGTFAHGQMYVALSRCTSLEGIVLKQPIAKKHIWMDWRVVQFVTRYQYGKAEEALPAGDKEKLILKAIGEGGKLCITYLKPNDEKSVRVIKPLQVGDFTYGGKVFHGLRAFCLKRGEERNFRIDRILEVVEQG
ncbi:MAG: AAA family ATPase [Chloroflexi bacterium]|nr:AAA family ATPase [Chloroflexota bacterium]